MSRLRATFAAEAEERLQAMNRDLLMLEGSTDRLAIEQLVEGLFREAHSLKGAARAVSVESVEVLAHRLENLFERLRIGELQPEPSVCDVVYRALDAMGSLAREATGADGAADVDVDALAARLDDPWGAAGGEPPSTPTAPPPVPAPAPAPTSVPAPAQTPRTPGDTVRVATSKLDVLLEGVGELVVAQTGAQQQLAELRRLADELQAWEAKARNRRWRRARGRPGNEDVVRLSAVRARVVDLHRRLQASSRRIAQVTTDVDDEVRRSRMLPVSAMLDAFPRMVRDIAREHGKEVTLVITGAETEVDRSLLEEMRAPLTHVVRNCVDHGLEDPDARLRAGKPRQGTITVGAYQQGGTLVLEVTDDGAGIDVRRVRAKALERGLIAPDTAETLSDRDVISLIFRSGLSTAPIITDLSGRGVGLDVVRESLERLHGMIDVDSTPGSGTRFKLLLPLSVSTTPCLLVRAGGQSFALPITSVSRIIHVTPEEVESVEGDAVIRADGSVVALARLADVLGITTLGAPADVVRPAVLLGSADRRTAFLVDELVDLRDVVTKALPPPFVRVRHLSGATILGTGEVVPILNAPDLIRTAAPARQSEEGALEAGASSPAVVLLAEDSITTRTLEKRILESAGYEVRAVGDGMAAWEALAAGGIDLVVADVHMPGLDGFELTARIRADERLRRVPVVLVTSRDSRSHRDRGVEVGADAYIVKGSFEQHHLVETVQRLT